MTASRESAQAKELCTPAELSLVRASLDAATKSKSAGEITKLATRARSLADKWNGLAVKQRRAAQQAKGAREVEVAKRSEAKAALFTAARARLERLAAAAATSGAPTRSAATKPSKRKRAAGHRAVRAAVRAKLDEVRDELSPSAANASPAPAKKAKKKTAKKKGAAPKSGPAAAKKTKKKVAKKGTKSTAAKKKATKKSVTSTPAPKKAVGLTSAKVAKTPKLRKAESAVKQARIQVSGKSTRVRGHVSARGKRAQGRRDGRG
ncbi:MAG: hypothetical protein KF688_06245 [Pirellulales bacterium]|nr:hypothetical protein [Pirellulales bacterium]